MAYPQSQPELREYLNEQAQKVNSLVKSFKLEDLKGSTVDVFVEKLVNSILPKRLITIKQGRVSTTPGISSNSAMSQEVLKDEIRTGWLIEGPEELIIFLPSRIHEAYRNKNMFFVELKLEYGALGNMEVMQERKNYLNTLTQLMEQAATKITDSVAKRREVIIKSATKSITELQQKLSADATRKKEADDFFNS